MEIISKKDFYFDLPQGLIAQTPIEPRSASRLLLLDKNTGKLKHDNFYNIGRYLRPGDVLILNDTKVLPARIYGKRDDTGAVVEFVLLKRLADNDWECIAGPGKKAREKHRFTFSDELRGEVIKVKPDGNRILRFEFDGEFYSILDRVGRMPLPPYIKKELKEQNRYQTVYAKQLGSAAAPTAGLHFTQDLLKQLREQGVEIGYVTLHVGLGTFRPVKTDNILEHKMHSEHYHISKETAELINSAKKEGRRVICVGTTSCRTVESAAGPDGLVSECSKDTDIFIYPGYKFKCMDALITNFHLPESTLIMLVSALAGRENILHAYQTAVDEKYRFFSFGDAMFITDSIDER